MFPEGSTQTGSFQRGVTKGTFSINKWSPLHTCFALREAMNHHHNEHGNDLYLSVSVSGTNMSMVACQHSRCWWKQKLESKFNHDSNANWPHGCSMIYFCCESFPYIPRHLSANIIQLQPLLSPLYAGVLGSFFIASSTLLRYMKHPEAKITGSR